MKFNLRKTEKKEAALEKHDQNYIARDENRVEHSKLPSINVFGHTGLLYEHHNALLKKKMRR